MAKPVGGTITLRDVAERSGVSITTVSRILNGRETGVPVRTRHAQRILAAAADLGYKPNLLARAPARQPQLAARRDRPGHLATRSTPRSSGASTRSPALAATGSSSATSTTSPDVAAIYGSMFEQSHADGILVLGDIAGGDATIDDLADHHDHVVGVSDRVGPRRVPGVYVDNERGTLLALEHLWELGHRSDHLRRRRADGRRSAAGRRLRAFMRDRGFGDRVRVVLHDPARPRARLPPRPRAVRPPRSAGPPDGRLRRLGHDRDRAAPGGVPARVVVPDQLSIVGFDDIDIASFTIPPLTTISQSGVEMGRIAANLLLDMIEGTIGATASVTSSWRRRSSSASRPRRPRSERRDGRPEASACSFTTARLEDLVAMDRAGPRAGRPLA